MDKLEIIKKFLLDESISLEIRKERFEIAWDIKEYFDKVLEELAYRKFINPLIERLKPILGDFIITKIYSSAIYIAKPHWKISANDRGIVSIVMERDKFQTTIGLVKNNNNKFPLEDKTKNLLKVKYGLRSTSDWLGYLPDERKPPTTKLPSRDFYLEILTNPKKVVEEHFQALKEVLDIANDKDISQLLEDLIKAKKEAS